MKNLFIILICLITASSLHAQVNNPGDVAKNDATDHANNNISNSIDNGLNKTEGAIKGLFKKKKKTDSNASKSNSQPVQSNTNNNTSASIGVYQNYDFVPGDKILFEDHFTDDQNGEFPAHWQLSGSAQGVVNTQQGYKSAVITDGGYYYLLPRITNKSYLGKEFTVEYDVYAEENAFPVKVSFHSASNMSAYSQEDNDNYASNLTVDKTRVEYHTNSSNFENLNANLPAAIAEDNFNNKWHHIAIGVKNNQLKVYVDQYRVLTVPDTHVQPVFVSFSGSASQETPIIFSNVKIAAGGGQNMIGKKFTDAKIVTHGINFDIDKATIRSESMGTLNMVVQVMKDNPDLKFEIDGHTDNTGSAPHNLTLSQQRADAVKAQLLSMGIDAKRLDSKGFGDTKPISDNNTLEGKANNRRVEFVKM